MLHIIAWIFLLIFLAACSSESPLQSPSFFWQEISGRDDAKNPARDPIYRAKAHVDWIRRDPLPKESICDTTKPLCEFLIKEGEEIIRITIHNFPTSRIEERIPPNAQIARWKRQLEQQNPTDADVIPQAYSGYAGLLFIGEGALQGKPVKMLGWSMQLAQEHYQTLSSSRTPDEERLHRQMRADFTIKALGPKHLMEKHQHDITAFAHSFELIQEIATRS
jgi:hypothetical protein